MVKPVLCRNQIIKIQKISPEVYVFWTTLVFYLTILFLNPSNYIVALSFIILFFVYKLKFKNIKLPLFYTFLSSQIIQTGKNYSILMLPPGFFSTDIYPHGYFVGITITASHILSVIILTYMIRQIVLKKQTVLINKTDALLIIFYILKIFSALIGSNNPGLSLPVEILSLGNLIVYFYARVFIKTNLHIWRTISYLFCSLLIFEGVLGFSQLTTGSSLGKNIEPEIGIENFGRAVDEMQFTFRPTGTFGHANALGIWAAAVCIFLFIFCLKYNSKILWFSLLTGFATAIITISRTAWIILAISIVFLFVYILRHQRKLLNRFILSMVKLRFIIIPIVLFLFLFFVLPRIQSSFYSFQEDSGAFFFRKIQTQDAIEIIRLHPVWGVGALMSVYEGISLNLNTMAMLIPFDVHNWYLTIAVQNGIPAILIFLFFLASSLREIIRKINNANIIYLSIAACIMSNSIAALIQPTINLELTLILLSMINYGTINPNLYVNKSTKK